MSGKVSPRVWLPPLSIQLRHTPFACSITAILRITLPEESNHVTCSGYQLKECKTNKMNPVGLAQETREGRIDGLI